MLTSTTVASNKQLSEDQAAHSRLLFNMTVRSIQQIRQRPERNPENKSAKATQPNLAHTLVNTDDSGQAQHAIEGTDLCWHFATALVYTIWLHCCCCLLACGCKLLHCGVSGCSDCSVAVVYLKWPDACVGRDQHLCCLLSHQGCMNKSTCTFIHTVC